MSILPQSAVLVLGATGLVGRVVYAYLNKKMPGKVFGTARKNKNTPYFKFEVENFTRDFQLLQKGIPPISVVINCIGVLRSSTASPAELILTNALFPNQLAQFLSPYSITVIHISSDAVFNHLAGVVTEKSVPSPEDTYGASKLLGEACLPHVLNVRTSSIGFDPQEKKGLLEWIRNTQKSTVYGFTSQGWSGCTVLQFGQLCEYFISHPRKFSQLLQKTSIFHFAPLTTTKYEIIKKTIELLKLSSTVQSESETLGTRKLESQFSEYIQKNVTSSSLSEALTELFNFEKTMS